MLRTGTWNLRTKAAVIFLAVLFVFAAVWFGFLYLPSSVYLFVNDTPVRVTGKLMDATSPTVQLDLQPGERDIVAMPWWWGEPRYLLKGVPSSGTVRPTVDLGFFHIVNLSDLEVHPTDLSESVFDGTNNPL